MRGGNPFRAKAVAAAQRACERRKFMLHASRLSGRTAVPRRERLSSASSAACFARASSGSFRRALEAIFSHYSTCSLLPFAALASFCKVIAAQLMIATPTRGPGLNILDADP